MSDVIAKKYINALMKSMDTKVVETTLASLKTLVPAFGSEKFNNILNSSDVSNADKEGLILSMIENPDAKLTNFIKLLSSNGRLTEIPSIVKELSKQIALKNNQYEGLLISNFKVKASEIKDIETSLSKKLNADIKLTNQVTDYPGIKVEVESLGIEVSFSQDRLKAQMAEHILNSL
ncbi:MAG TPA: F0F1 ATP synthase subunit delta [Campylobacterales bacterium]|nr:F0F1 ATP synthase subunit delta [Campylobacterales bacterium]